MELKKVEELEKEIKELEIAAKTFKYNGADIRNEKICLYVGELFSDDGSGYNLYSYPKLLNSDLMWIYDGTDCFHNALFGKPMPKLSDEVKISLADSLFKDNFLRKHGYYDKVAQLNKIYALVNKACNIPPVKTKIVFMGSRSNYTNRIVIANLVNLFNDNNINIDIDICEYLSEILDFVRPETNEYKIVEIPSVVIIGNDVVYDFLNITQEFSKYGIEVKKEDFKIPAVRISKAINEYYQKQGIKVMPKIITCQADYELLSAYCSSTGELLNRNDVFEELKSYNIIQSNYFDKEIINNPIRLEYIYLTNIAMIEHKLKQFAMIEDNVSSLNTLNIIDDNAMSGLTKSYNKMDYEKRILVKRKESYERALANIKPTT